MKVQYSARKTSGFTLIELSIVLVIIGLIIGGIIIGQEMISAAQARAQVTQIDKFNTAVNTFYDKYGGLPGDLALKLANQFGFATTNCLGDGSSPYGARNGNGVIEGNGVSGYISALMGENLLFWTDLSTAGYIPGAFPGGGAGPAQCYASSLNLSLTAGPNYVGDWLPAAEIGGRGTFVHVYGIGGINWYLLAQIPSFSSTSSVVVSYPMLPVSQAYNIDKKVDDGIPTTGNIQAVYLNTWPVPAPNAATDSATTCYNTTGPSYSVGYNGGSNPNCALSFRMQGGAR